MGYRGTPTERFWRFVDKTGKCWLWTGGTFKAGKRPSYYGQFRLNGKSVLAHRASWEFHFGKIPNGEDVLHKCDVRLCVNPDHLFLGNQDDNMKDMASKGRASKRGCPKKLTAELAEKIRELAGKLSQRAIARQFGISQSHVSLIFHGKTWNR